MEEYRNFYIQPELVTVRAKNLEDAKRMAQIFYQKQADASYFHEGINTQTEALIGPGCQYDLSEEDIKETK